MIKTMGELLLEFAPGKTVKDSGTTRAIARIMREKGFKRKRMRWQGKIQWVWTNEEPLSALAMRINDALPSKRS